MLECCSQEDGAAAGAAALWGDIPAAAASAVAAAAGAAVALAQQHLAGVAPVPAPGCLPQPLPGSLSLTAPDPQTLCIAANPLLLFTVCVILFLSLLKKSFSFQNLAEASPT